MSDHSETTTYYTTMEDYYYYLLTYIYVLEADLKKNRLAFQTRQVPTIILNISQYPFEFGGENNQPWIALDNNSERPCEMRTFCMKTSVYFFSKQTSTYVLKFSTTVI